MISLLKIGFDIDDALKAPFVNRFKGEGVTEVFDIPYSADVSDKCRMADVYIPKPAGKKFPVLINIHGGGWVTGDKKWRHSIGNIFAQSGIFVFAPNYCLSPEYKFPEPLTDIFNSINWLADNAEKYNIDLENVFISGDSAGGHLSVSVAAFYENNEVKKNLGLPDLKIKPKGVMPLCGIYDFALMAKTAGSGGIVKNFTGFSRKKLREFGFFPELSPVNYITPSFPPAFILSGGHDIFTKPQPAKLKEKLDEAGVKYFHHEGRGISGADHCFHLRWQQKESRYVFVRMIDFILSNS